MNKKLLIILAFIIVAALGLFIFQNQAAVRDEEKVAVTIFPLFDIVKNIAGDQVAVELILPPGASPHTHDPLPSETLALTGSRVLFAIGHGLDNWSETIAKSANIEKVIVVDRNISLIDSTHDHHHEEESAKKEETDYSHEEEDHQG